MYCLKCGQIISLCNCNKNSIYKSEQEKYSDWLSKCHPRYVEGVMRGHDPRLTGSYWDPSLSRWVDHRWG